MLKLISSTLIVLTFMIFLLPSCTINRTAKTDGSYSSNSYGSNSNAYGSKSSSSKKCSMDIQCGTGYKCSSGVCTGGIVPKIKGDCVRGNFGKKVCSNTGKKCHVDSECFK